MTKTELRHIATRAMCMIIKDQVEQGEGVSQRTLAENAMTLVELTSKLLDEKILVEVLGGVADSDHPRVYIHDWDNYKEEDKATQKQMRKRLKELKKE